MLDLSHPRRLHVVGIGGAGMSAIATVLAAMGHAVGGSDRAASPVLDRLAALGIEVYVGHRPDRVAGVDALAVSTAVPADDPEVVAARAAGIPVLRRAEALAAIAATRRTLAVSGAAGKTTTTALLALALRDTGLDPSFIVGGDIVGTGGAAWGTGEWFVVEADESDGTFLELGAEGVVVTTVEPDHLDHWGSLDAIRAAFRRFLADAPAFRVVCADDPEAMAAAGDVEARTYGTSPQARHRLVDVEAAGGAVSFTLTDGESVLGRLEVPLPGVHNARNAAAATVAALAVGADFDSVAASLRRFPGVARRFQRRGEVAGVTFVDDYAHNPGKVAAALAAAAAGGWRRVVCVFQPHLFSRTVDLLPGFAGAFDDADVLAVTDIYPAREAPRSGVTGKLVVDAVLDRSPYRRVAWLPTRADVRRWLLSELRPGDLCLTLGAGDITTLPDEVIPDLAAREAAR